jgi:hypothetical protein
VSPKWRSAIARVRSEGTTSGTRALLIGGVGLIFWLVVFGVVYRVLRYFRGVEEIGFLLASKLLGLVLLAFL